MTQRTPKIPPQQAVARQSKAVQLLMGASGTKTSGNKPGYGKLNSEPQKFNINKPKKMMTPISPKSKAPTQKPKVKVNEQIAGLKKMMGAKGAKKPAPKSKIQNPSFIGGNKQFYGPPFGYKNK